ncbi:hypothetical protein OTV1_123 [Ostreococcus tauri virus 1]|uniref:hypothetical protein n=1 Tax=Ostreococcus tauri virus 1 TaxID=642926 RepID=UPI0001B5F75E|nr:hypothetical protein OTV1_123 [Ostreococcus tauri virus 1]CAY39711.1 hypothetical protein OTV1_123 [Ostreococcus tauri virus 1]
MVCDVIEECRCYAYSDVTDTKKYQFCGVRKGPKVLPCPSDCCAGGCPGDFPKEPFRIIERPTPEVVTDLRIPILVLLVVAQLLVIIW